MLPLYLEIRVDESDEGEFSSTTKSHGLAGLADLGSILSYLREWQGRGGAAPGSDHFCSGLCAHWSLLSWQRQPSGREAN